MKRIITVLCILLMVGFMQGVYTGKAYATVKPQISFVGIGHSPLVQGDTETFLVTSISNKQVQYRLFLIDVNKNTKKELTSGYTDLMDSKTPYKVSPTYVFDIGKYKLETWVREEGSVNSYDNDIISNLNCVNRDNKNRVYANGDMIIDKDTYNVGEKVIINGIKDIGGITGPYKYRLHIFSPDKIGKAGYGFDNTGWAKNVTRYADTIEWTPQEPGTYVLDVHAITPNSTLWKNILRDSDTIYGGYEAWKLKTITVVGDPIIPTVISNEEFVSNLYKNNSNYWDQGLKYVNGVLNIKKYDSVTGVNSLEILPTTFNKNINTQLIDTFRSIYTEKEGFRTEAMANIGEDDSIIGSLKLFIKNSTISGREFISINLRTSSNSNILNKNTYADFELDNCTLDKFNNYKYLLEKPIIILTNKVYAKDIYNYVIEEYNKCVISNSYNITTYKQFYKNFGDIKVAIWSNGKIVDVRFIK